MSEELSSQQVDEISAANKEAYDSAVTERNSYQEKAEIASQRAAAAADQASQARTNGATPLETWNSDGAFTKNTALSSKASASSAQAERNRKAALLDAKEHFEANSEAYYKAGLDSNPEEMAKLAAKASQHQTESSEHHQPAA